MESEKRSRALHELDMKYVNVSHQADLTVKDEQTRRLRVRNVLVRDENDVLKDQLSQRDGKVKDLVSQKNRARGQLDGATIKFNQQEKRLRSQTREIANMKEELKSLNGVSQDATELLAEKLALSRELAALKPEIEHLRSQLSNHSDTLKEKLALERQVNSLEVELANEKRAAQKIIQKQDKDNEVEDDLREQVRELERQRVKDAKMAEKIAEEHQTRSVELEAELQQAQEQLGEAEKNLAVEKRAAKRLAKQHTNQESNGGEALEDLQEELKAARQALEGEKLEKQRIQQECQQAVAEITTQHQSSQAKLHEMESQLKTSRTELKKCRADLEKAQEQTLITAAATTTTVPTKTASKALSKALSKAPARKKRRAMEITSDDIVIETPNKVDDRIKRPLKKRGPDQTLVGEKSMFSITPFLNKTINFTEVSPGNSENNTTKTHAVFQFRGADDATTTALDAEEDEGTVAQVAVEGLKVPSSKARGKLLDKKPKGRPKKLLGEAPASKRATAQASRKTPRTEPTLANVMEEEDEAAQEKEDLSTESTGISKEVSSTADKSLESRSMVSTEAEPKKKKRKVLGSSNKPRLFEDDDGELQVAKRPAKPFGVTRVTGKMPMGKAKSAFAGASFSPLKRDRRGVHASFLA